MSAPLQHVRATMCPRPGCSKCPALLAVTGPSQTILSTDVRVSVNKVFAKQSACCQKASQLGSLACHNTKKMLDNAPFTLRKSCYAANACVTRYVWCRGWRKRQGRSMSSCSPTEGVSCPHGALLPAALGPRAKRISVPPLLWDYFKDNWQRAEAQHQQQQAETPSEAAGAADSPEK